MKMTINVEMTPEELRRFLGLPDVGPAHEEWLEQYRKQLGQMDPAAAGIDPAALLRSLPGAGLAGSPQAMEAFSKAFWSAFSGAAAKPASGSDKADPKG